MGDNSLLAELGWSPYWEAHFEPYIGENIQPARVVRGDRGSSLVVTAEGVFRARPSSRLLKARPDSAAMPVVGDWIAVISSKDMDDLLVLAVLERKSEIKRWDSGKTFGTQVLAANIDIVFVVHPIADSPNLRRLERELSLAWDSGAVPVVVLTKVDLATDPTVSLAAVESIALGVDVLSVNAQNAADVEQLLKYIPGHSAAVLLGPSGAGKSTIINSLLGEGRQATGDVRQGDGRGRHTTVARELVKIPGHGVIVDTPGLRAIGLTGSDVGISHVFPDIEQLASSCRFRDCSHNGETGCAVELAVESGLLPLERLASYHKLVREAQFAASKSNVHLRAEEKRKNKTLSRTIKEYYKRGGDN